MKVANTHFLKTVLSAATLSLLSLPAFALVIGHNTVVDAPTTYSNTELDLTNGNFIVKNGASLTIENSTIKGTISSENPNLISVERGALNLSKNQVSISASSLEENSKLEASFYAIKLGRATADINGNSFVIDKPYTAGFLTTSVTLPATNLKVINNTFEHFHGVLYLLNSSNSLVEGNNFKLNSSGQIVLVGNKSLVTGNSIFFAGLNQLGDAIDVIASEEVTIAKNNIFTPTSIGVAITLSRQVRVDQNTITGGVTYGINILSNAELKNPANFSGKILAKMDKKKLAQLGTQDITITNNFLGQNRYGVAATDVTNLTVTGNYFSQRFDNAAARKFWTDNNVLLKNISGLTWVNNFYKEAFTQVNGGDNSNTQIVAFPASGGVVLE